MLLANIKNVDQLIFELVKLGYKRGEDLESLWQGSNGWADFNTYTFGEPLTVGYHDVVYCVEITPRKIIHEGAPTTPKNLRFWRRFGPQNSVWNRSKKM